MPDQTNPEPGVVSESSLESALEAGFSLPPRPPKVAAPEPEPEEPAEPESPVEPVSDELTPDDIPDVEGQAAEHSADDAFEIVHKGTQHKLTREETIKYAQQGFDYTQKTQAVAEKERQIDVRLAKLQEVEQMQHALAPDLAQVKAVEAQLKAYKDVDWVQLATDNPLEYPKHRAQYDSLTSAYNSAVGQFQSKAQAIQNHRREMTAQTIEQQRTRLLELQPSWKDPAKFEQGAKAVKEYLARKGVPQERIDTLTDATAVDIAYKAHLYEQLQEQKAAKVKQLRTAPPVAKPGAVSQQVDGKTDFKKFTQDFKRAGKHGHSRTQEGLLEQRLSRVFKI